MSEEEKKAIETLNKDKSRQLAWGDVAIIDTESIDIILKLINKQQKQLKDEKIYSRRLALQAQKYFEKLILQDKIINKMSEYIDFRKMNFNCLRLYSEDVHQKIYIREYFTKLIEEEEKNNEYI